MLNPDTSSDSPLSTTRKKKPNAQYKEGLSENRGFRKSLFVNRKLWAFFHRRLSPAVELGGVWPPSGIFAVIIKREQKFRSVSSIVIAPAKTGNERQL
jgi:hypothetical protein